MLMPIDEVVDRFTIWKLKVERIGGEGISEAYNEYLKALQNSVNDYKVLIKNEWVDELYKYNSMIWDLESDIRKMKDEELGYEEIGRRSIEIRKINKLRVGVKNKIIEETGKGFKDVKMNHGSE